MLALLLVASGALAAVPPAHAAPGISAAVPTSYELDLAYDPARRGTVTGTETIRFRNMGPAAIDRIWLRLWANGPDRCRPARIDVSVSAPAVAEPTVDCTALPVRLGAAVGPGGAGEIVLGIAVSGRGGHDRFGRSGPARLFGNVVPVLAVTDQLGLHLEPYSDTGESFYSLAARWDATLRMPRRIRAATTGSVGAQSVAGGIRTMTVASAGARDFGLAFVSKPTVLHGRSAGVSVEVLAASRRTGRKMLRAAKRSLRRLSARLGPYASSELDLVETRAKHEIAMEYPELVFSPPDPVLVAHEVAHQWWYGIVGDNQAADPWLDESLASYSDAIVFGGFKHCRLKHPFRLLPKRWRKLRLDAPMSSWEGRGKPYGAVVYVVGACVLRSLERSIGRDRMTELLRLLVARHRFGVIDRADLLRAIEEVAPPGFPLQRFLARAHLSG